MIPDGVTSIGKYAFDGCENLTAITIPDSIEYIGEDVIKYSVMDIYGRKGTEAEKYARENDFFHSDRSIKTV